MGGGNYFKEVLIEPNFSFIVLPRLFTTVMIASAIPAAIRPYSIAVAPDSSDQDLRAATYAENWEQKFQKLNPTEP